MRNFYVGLLVVCVTFGAGFAWGAGRAVAADAEIEQQIRTLEGEEVQAILAHDIGTLERLWDKAYVVHNPEGRIVPAGANITDRPVFQNPRASFVREVESIVINGDVAFSMGSEIVTPTLEGPKAGQVIRRRYTNVWLRKDGAWKLSARHANKVCGAD
jgi:ketosteroid isomerase-like protein